MGVAYKLGSLSPIVYFINHRDPAHHEGYIMLAPTSWYPTPEGYSRHEATCLPEIDTLQKRMLEQCQREWEAERLTDEMQWKSRWDRVTDNLYSKLTSAATSEYEKEFIRLYLQLREDKRERHRQRFTERTAYLHLREFDAAPGRRDDEERVNLDRITVR